jgi:excinuclease ABC subunit C
MTVEEFKQVQPNLPKQPGVYRFINADGKVLYVGKAKNLWNRVTSYFVSIDEKIARLQMLVKQATHIEFTIVNSERDAYLLEESLIKALQPRYNIALKDGKTYPYLCLSNEPFPRLFISRKLEHDGTLYFGPYPSGNAVQTMIELLHKLYKIRTCYLNLSEKNISAQKFKVCLEYHIGNCKAPCVGYQSLQDYDENMQQIKLILKGNVGKVLQTLQHEMNVFVEKWQYEKAEEQRKKINYLEGFKERATIVNPLLSEIEVYSLVREEDLSFVNFMKVMNGTIVQTQTIELKSHLDETKEEVLQYAIRYFHSLYKTDAVELIVPFEIEWEIENITVTIPQRGDKKNLLDLSLKNSIYYKNKRLSSAQNFKIKTEEFAVLKELQRDFRLTELPLHIECFDNSNFQGDYPVSAMVVFKQGKPSKKDYRHYNIKTVEGPNDFASMEEVIERRYTRVLAEAGELPQLIIIDGGKGQLSAAYSIIEKLGLKGKLAIASIAKKLEEIYMPNDSLPLHISKKSPSLKLIQQLRDEAHRFGITHHRSQRDKATLKPQLTKINGIGEATNLLLLKHFKSVIKIKQATTEEIETIVGKHKAGIVKKYFEEKEK